MPLRTLCLRLVLSVAFISISSSQLLAAYENAPAADNTAVNARDRDDRTLTAEDQAKGSPQDVQLTRKIRQELTGLKSLSVDGKNVKIITINRVVTLRGPVASNKERIEIGRMARNVPGVQKVRNDLEISASR